MTLFRLPTLNSNQPVLWTIPFGLLLAYYIGLRLKTVIIVLLVIISVWVWLSQRLTILTNFFSIRYLQRGLVALIVFFPLLVIGVQAARMYTGTQGVDFGIYAQVVHRFAELNQFDMSIPPFLRQILFN